MIWDDADTIASASFDFWLPPAANLHLIAKRLPTADLTDRNIYSAYHLRDRRFLFFAS
jgi:hypothetical protein